MKKIVSFLLAVVMLAGLLAGCTQSEPQQSQNPNPSQAQEQTPETLGGEAARGGTLNFASSTINIWAPWLQTKRFLQINKVVYEPLNRRDENGVMQPFLAELIPDADSKTVTIKLKDGITFSGGSPLNAEALAWNLRLWRQYVASSVGNFSDIEETDDMTVTLTFDTWSLDIINLLGNIVVCSKKNYDDHASASDLDTNGYSVSGLDWINQQPIGTGAFTLDASGSDNQQDVVQKFRARSDYWQEGLPYLDAVYIHSVSTLDDVVFQTAYLNCDYDIGGNGSTQVEDALIASGDFYDALENVVAGTIPVFLCNSNATVDGQENPFADVRVRKALLMAIDIKVDIVEGFFKNRYAFTNQLGVAGTDQYVDSLEDCPYDVEGAIALLNECGYNENNKLVVPVNIANSSKDEAIIIQQAWSKLPCVEVNLATGLDYNELRAALLQGNFMGYIAMRVTMTADNFSEFDRFFGPSSAEKAFGSENLAQACQAMRTAPDKAARDQCIKDIVRIVHEECLLIPFYYVPTTSYAHNYVKGLNYVDTDTWSPELTWLADGRNK